MYGKPRNNEVVKWHCSADLCEKAREKEGDRERKRRATTISELRSVWRVQSRVARGESVSGDIE